MSVLTSILAFILGIGILIAIHEYGHYWVAKKLGVKVLRFSIGFGKPLWKKIAGADQTEYVVAAIPLGGYVKMLDERESEVPADEVDRAFNRQPLKTRAAVVAAGPMANFLFAIFAYMMMYIVGVNGIKPVIGEVAEDSIAAKANIESGSTIVSINQIKTPDWETALLTLIKEALDSGQIDLVLNLENGSTEHRFMNLSNSRSLLGEGDALDNIGIKPWRPKIPAVFGKLIETGAAAKAGLLAGDQVLQADNKQILLWSDMVDVIRNNPDKSIELLIQRGDDTLEYSLTPEAVNDGGVMVGRIGALPQTDKSEYEAMRVTVRYGPVEALWRGITRTWDMSLLTVRVLWKIVVGEASMKNISGPLTMAEYAGVSALIGVAAFLGFLGIVSVSLGVLNLLPIPVLDGGHLLYYLIEWIKGGPVPETVEALGQRIGLVLLGCLMFVAFYNDIARLLG